MTALVALLACWFIGSVSSQRIIWSGSPREITIPLDGTGPQISGIPLGPQISGIPLGPKISVIPLPLQISGTPLVPQTSAQVEVRSQPWLLKTNSFPQSQTFTAKYPHFPLRYPKVFPMPYVPKPQIQTPQQPLRLHYPQMHGYQNLKPQIKQFKPQHGAPLSAWKNSPGGNVLVVPFASSNKVQTDPVVMAGYIRALKSGDPWKPTFLPGQVIPSNLLIPGGGVVLAGDGSDATVAGPAGSFSIDGGDVDRVSVV
ncbi:uncharacterized protein [Haliotis cracherodii]|uniref:uncharacterized protein n=1 Tax=Haliotis cracherodii TaxID=6455 RepID=UPI0039E88208